MRREEEQKERSYGWLYGLVAGCCVAAMEIGVGLLQMGRREALLLGGSQGLLVGALTIICGGIMEWLLLPVKEEEEERLLQYRQLHPGRSQVAKYQEAFHSLAQSITRENPEKTIIWDAQAKAERLWNTRLMENRAVVALQLDEMAQIVGDTVEHVWDLRVDEDLETQVQKKLRRMGLTVHGVMVYTQEKKRQEVYLTLNTRRRRCVAVKEIAAVLTKLMNKAMMPAKDSRAFVGSERITLLFVERTNFEVLYGIEKAVKGKEQISGDNFSFCHCREGQLIAALSDGMGSGAAAYRESELVVDLLEQFLEAGFCKETAVRMINSALLVRSDAQTFSTIDMCSLDLYSGVCEFLKVGASTTFIRRDNWVETISSTSLPAGVFQKPELDCTSKKLYDGDMVILVTDGVMDALPAEHQESLMKDIIMEHMTGNPKELAAYILGRVQQYRDDVPADDMTVLVLGIVKY